MRTYRIASVLQGLGYLALTASLVIRPPGKWMSVIQTNGERFDIPQHVTFFQQVLSSQFWALVFGALAMILIIVAVVAKDYLKSVHAFFLVTVTAFACGYFVSAVQLHTGWAVASLAFVAAVSHGFFVRHKPPTVLE